MDQVLGIVGVHLQLFEDNALLLLHIVGAESGVQHQVREDVEGQRQMVVENLGVEADQFLRSEGVQVATDGIDGAGDLLRATRERALEEHVLDEMADAVLVWSLAARAARDPDAGGHRSHVGHRFGDNANSVGQQRSSNLARQG